MERIPTHPKVLVLGATGMLGHIVFKILTQEGFETYGTSRMYDDSYLQFDAQEPFERLGKYMDNLKFDVIVNCIGMLIKESSQSKFQALRVNAHLPKWLEQKTQGSSTRVIHISTDCVFHGDRGFYSTSDAPDAKTIYGISKAQGELNNAKDITLRTSIIGPDLKLRGEGLFHWFMQRHTDEVLYGYQKAYWSGVSTIELAHVIKDVILQPQCGLVHVSRNENISKYDLLNHLNTIRKSQLTICKDEDYCVDKSLRASLNFEVSSCYNEMVCGIHNWILENSKMYPHYITDLREGNHR